MKTDRFLRVADSRDLAADRPNARYANGADVVLVRSRNGWRAFEGRCPHKGALLGEGEIEGDRLVCRNHRWRFALDTGQRDGGPECLTSCPALEREGALFVDVSTLPRAARTVARRSLDELPGPKGLPLLGNLLELDPIRMHLILEGWAVKYGSTYQFRIGHVRIVVTSDPALVDQVLRNRPETFRRQAKMDAAIRDMDIEGVFNVEGDAWRSQRKLTVAALSQRHVRSLYPSIRMVAERLRAHWRQAADEGRTLDLVEEFKRYTVDVTMLIVFGHDSNTVETSGDVIQRHLEIVFPTLSRRLFALAPVWRYVRTPEEKRLQRALGALRAWLGNLIADARNRLEANPHAAEHPANFLEAMLTSVDERGEPFSDHAIKSNLMTLLLAGEDTTAYSLAWAVHHLSDSQEWAERIRREAHEALGADGVAVSFDVTSRLGETDAVVNEVLRLRPAAPIHLLDANIDTTLGDFLVPKGAHIAVLARPAALVSENFHDPLEFRPERWLETGVGTDKRSISIPFGMGPRICPGRSLALLEMRTLLSMLYRNFVVERVSAPEDVAERFGFTMHPAELKVRLTARANG